jgi:hypothetical protein
MEAASQKSRRELLGNVGSSGGSIVIGTVALNWLDCLRVRWQATPTVTTGTTTLPSFFVHILQTEGLVSGLWMPGLAANICACGTSYALRVGTYPLLRDCMVFAIHGEGGSKAGHTMFAAGFASGVLGFFLSTPLWQLKTRMHAEAGLLDASGVLTTGAAAGRVPYFEGVVSGLARLWQEGGLRHLWHGAMPLVARGALLSGGQQFGYDGTKTLCKREGLLNDGVQLHVASSVVAAFWAATFAAPFDVLLTRYQTGRADGTRWDSLRQCAAAIASEGGGLRIFFRGWTPFFGRLAPLALITLPLYEQIRKRVFGLEYLE